MSAAASVPLDEAYAYDNINRLTQMKRGTLGGGVITGTPVVQQNWTLDPTGNWSNFATLANGDATMTQTRTSSTVNEITAIGSIAPPPPPSGTPTPTAWVTPGYDAAGNMTTMPQVADPTQSFTAVYDAWNRMVSVSASGSTVAEYQYDGQNRRIVKLTYSGGTLSETRHFYFTSDWQDIEERLGTSTSMDKQYVWGTRYIDELICRDDPAPQRLYACQDANFNVTSITDTTGSVEERYLYDPYGNLTAMNGSWAVISSSAYSWSFMFQDLMTDVTTRVVTGRTRDYTTLLGSWLQRDLIQYTDSANLYLFEVLNPLNSVDPFGLIAGVAMGRSNGPGQGSPCCLNTVPYWLYWGYASYSACVDAIFNSNMALIPFWAKLGNSMVGGVNVIFKAGGAAGIPWSYVGGPIGAWGFGSGTGALSTCDLPVCTSYGYFCHGRCIAKGVCCV